MKPHSSLRFSSGRAALLATACLVVPLLAGENRGAGTAAQRETDRRRIDIQEAEELLSKGDESYQAGRYGEAVQAFQGARELIPDAPVSRDLRKAATDRLVTASIEQARALSHKGDVAGAGAVLDAVLAAGVAPGNPAALAARAEIDDPIRTNPAATKEHAANVDQVRRLLYQAEGAYDLGKFDESAKLYQSVLRIDSTNTAARRGMEQVAAAKSRYAKSAIDQTRAEMLSQVDATWEHPVPPEAAEPLAMEPGADLAPSASVPLANKIERIIIPSLMLDGASLEEAVDLLRQRSAEFDTFEADPARRGVNFALDLGKGDTPTSVAARDSRFNLRLENVPLSKALKYVCDQTRTTYSVDPYAVVIRPTGAESKQLETRTFRVAPGLLTALNDLLRTSGSGDTGGAAAPDPFSAAPSDSLPAVRMGLRDVLAKLNVAFPDGSSVSLNGDALTAVNTPSNLEQIGALVDTAQKTEPVQVHVTVRMIKCENNRLKELGFDWLVGALGMGGNSWIPGARLLNVTGGTTGNGGNLGDILMPPGMGTNNPVTAGNRSGDEAGYRDALDSVIGVDRSNDNSLGLSRAPGTFQVTRWMNDSTVQLMMRGLDQKKGVDISTQISTIVKNGAETSVRSVREMPYPQSYEPPELPNSAGDGGDDNTGIGYSFRSNSMPVTPSHPTDFTKKEIGVTLQVTPTVDAAKKIVDVTLVPTVTDFDGFVNYGSAIRQPTTVSAFGLINPLRARATELTPNRILMPVFSTKRVTTSVSVADGCTVALGGMIQDRRIHIDDKTPILGELPIVGRLFQSKITRPVSISVIFLVKVRVVDATGRPFNANPEQDAPPAPPATAAGQ